MNLSPFTANKIARWFAGNNMPTAPTDMYLALFDGNPLGSGIEVGADVTGAAARIAIPHVDPANDGASNTLTNSADVDFGTSASVTPLFVDYLAIYDAVSGGNCLATKSITQKTINQGAEVKVATGDLDLEIVKTS